MIIVYLGYATPFTIIMCTQFGLLVEVVKVTASMFVVTVFLLSVSEVNSKCPFSSGKTLDVYNNNCISFYRYLHDAQRRLLLYTCGDNVNSETNKKHYHVFYLILV